MAIEDHIDNWPLLPSVLGEELIACQAEDHTHKALTPNQLAAFVNAGSGDMTKAIYDPQTIEADAFARVNHTGEQAISTITNLQTTLDAKAETAADIGLGNVDNTSDLNKPISTATQSALDTKLTKDGTDAMTGNLDMSGNSINNANNVAATSVNATTVGATTVTATLVNGVGLTAAGSGLNSLREDGTYAPVTMEFLMRASSFIDQVPVGTDTPLQITFGAAQGLPTDPLELDASGNFTINEDGQYEFYPHLQYGRVGAAGASLIFFRVLVNGLQFGNSVGCKLDSSDSNLSLLAFPIPLDLFVNDIVTFEIIRDSQGDNSGELQTETVTAGWTAQPSAAVTIRRIA